MKSGNNNKARARATMNGTRRNIEKGVKFDKEEDEDEDEDSIVIIDDELTTQEIAVLNNKKRTMKSDRRESKKRPNHATKKVKGERSSEDGGEERLALVPAGGGGGAVVKKKEKRGRKRKDKTEKSKIEEVKKKWWDCYVLPELQAEEEKKKEVKQIHTLYGATIDTDNLPKEDISTKTRIHETIDYKRMELDRIIEIILLGRYDGEALEKKLDHYMTSIVEIVESYDKTLLATNNQIVEAMRWIKEGNVRPYKIAAIFFMIDTEKDFVSHHFLSLPKRTPTGQIYYEMRNVIPDTFVYFMKFLLPPITERLMGAKEVTHNTLVEYAIECCHAYFCHNVPPYMEGGGGGGGGGHGK